MNLLAHLIPMARRGSKWTAAARGLLKQRAWRNLAVVVFLAAVPFGSWLMGSGVEKMAPRSYRSMAEIRMPESYGRAALGAEQERMRSSEVMNLAARALADAAGRAQVDPTDVYLLWSSVEATPVAGENLIRLAVRGPDAQGTQQRLEAVVQAYRQVAGVEQAGQPQLVMPEAATQVTLSTEVRMVLGLAGFAGLALVLSIPLLTRLEQLMPRIVTV